MLRLSARTLWLGSTVCVAFPCAHPEKVNRRRRTANGRSVEAYLGHVPRSGVSPQCRRSATVSGWGASGHRAGARRCFRGCSLGTNSGTKRRWRA